jgi:hypothetical protein
VEKIIVVESKEVKTGCNVAESSKEGYGSKKRLFGNDYHVAVVDWDITWMDLGGVIHFHELLCKLISVK